MWCIISAVDNSCMVVYYQRSCGSVLSGLVEQEEKRELAPKDLWPLE